MEFYDICVPNTHNVLQNLQHSMMAPLFLVPATDFLQQDLKVTVPKPLNYGVVFKFPQVDLVSYL